MKCLNVIVLTTYSIDMVDPVMEFTPLVLCVHGAVIYVAEFNVYSKLFIILSVRLT